MTRQLIKIKPPWNSPVIPCHSLVRFVDDGLFIETILPLPLLLLLEKRSKRNFRKLSFSYDNDSNHYKKLNYSLMSIHSTCKFKVLRITTQLDLKFLFGFFYSPFSLIFLMQSKQVHYNDHFLVDFNAFRLTFNSFSFFCIDFATAYWKSLAASEKVFLTLTFELSASSKQDKWSFFFWLLWILQVLYLTFTFFSFQGFPGDQFSSLVLTL